mmetsp:Transcript_1939/g.3459  ORF Transcript_1939/g.3459 Transcript_1939/m.3459 type:complete len:462 (+) Transcript_1939:1689-3074(+)
MKASVFFCVSVCLCVSVGVNAFDLFRHTEWTADDLPNPVKNPRACGRLGVDSSWICDPNQILSAYDADTIEGTLGFISNGTAPFKKVSCGNDMVGVEIAVVVIPSMKLGFFDNKQLSAEEFAKKIHDLWGVGDAECDFGAVVFLSVNDRVVYISTGKGVRKMLPDEEIQSIIEVMRPYLRDEDYGEAVLRGVSLIGRVVSGEKITETSLMSRLSSLVFGFFALGVFLFAVVAIVWIANGIAFVWFWISRRKEREEYRRCKSQLSRLDEDRARARANAYEQRSCPICLEDFDLSEQSKESTRYKESPMFDEEAANLLPDAKSNPASHRAIRTLVCGHMFCDICIESWMSSSSNMDCPICREPVNKAAFTRTRSYETRYQSEFNFRLNRLRSMFPTLITPYYLSRWTNDLNQHSFANDIQLPSFDPIFRSSANAYGHHGSSHGNSGSFGGGSSAGGGGGGGSW